MQARKGNFFSFFCSRLCCVSRENRNEETAYAILLSSSSTGDTRNSPAGISYPSVCDQIIPQKSSAGFLGQICEVFQISYDM